MISADWYLLDKYDGEISLGEYRQGFRQDRNTEDLIFSNDEMVEKS